MPVFSSRQMMCSSVASRSRGAARHHASRETPRRATSGTSSGGEAEGRHVQDAPHGAVADLDTLLANVSPSNASDQCVTGTPTSSGGRHASASMRAASASEREGRRAVRGASTSLSAGCSASKRRRHSCTVRMRTPTARAMSVPGTASAIISRAVARRTIRCSAVAGRIAASTLVRSSAESTSGTVGRPPCGRCANAA